jgi:histidine ammonia-lyase
VSASRIRDYLDGSGLCAAGVAASVQDPLSFRVAPQVHGAYRAVLDVARVALDGELAAIDDNPLVSVETGTMISNGNFHPMFLALAIDAIRPALAHAGVLSDRRTGQVWDRLVSDPGSFTADGLARMARYGSPLLRYSGAVRAAELRSLVGPVTHALPPLVVGVEDPATNAPLAVRRTDDALAHAEDVLATELLTATASIGSRDESRDAMAPRTRRVLDRIGATIAGLGDAPPSHAVHAEIRDLLFGPLLDDA